MTAATMTSRPPTKRQIESWVRAHSTAVYRAARRVVLSDADAKDVTQQVFLRALEGRGGSAPRDARAALCWSARRLGLTALRDRARRAQREAGAPVREAAPATDTVAAERELCALVARALGELPDELRVAVTLRYQEGLTLAEVAELTETAESTAHARVERGVAQLGRRVKELCGIAAVPLAGVEELPRALAEVAAPHIPAGLDVELSRACLAATAAVAGKGAVAIGIGALIALGAGIAFALGEWRSEAAPPQPTPVTSTEEPSRSEAAHVGETAPENRADDATARRAVASVGEGQALDPPATTLPDGTATGVVTTRDGDPLAGVEVVATSVEFTGKQPRFVRRGTTDAAGAYALALPCAHRQGQFYALKFEQDGFAARRVDEVLIASSKKTEVEPVALDPWARTREGKFRLIVDVVNTDGHAVEGAVVICRQRSQLAQRPLPAEGEERGATDATGRAVLDGAVLGEKQIEVQARAAGYQAYYANVSIDAEGEHRRHVVVEPGLSITGTVRTLDGTPVRMSLYLRTEAEPNTRIEARTDAEGRFETRGLSRADYTLRNVTHPWSSFERDVAAGTTGLDIRVKRYDDARSDGWHDGELHGRVVDASTGQAIPGGGLSVLARPIEPLPEGARLPADALLAAWRPWNVQISILGQARDDTAFHATGLRGAAYVLATHIRGYAPAYLGPFDMRDTRVVRDLEIRMQRGATVGGVVVDATGRPVSQAWVALFGDVGFEGPEADRAALDQSVDPARGSAPDRIVRTVRTDMDGRYEFEHVPPDLPFRLAAVHVDYRAVSGPRLVPAEGGNHRGLRLQFGVRR